MKNTSNQSQDLAGESGKVGKTARSPLTTIIYRDGTDYRYTESAPSVDLETQTVTICDNENGVIDTLNLTNIAEISFELR